MEFQHVANSPISDPDNLDIVGERVDGGVDMMIVTASTLDDSEATCQRLKEKLGAYLFAATHANFKNKYPASRTGRVRIFVSDSHGISDRAYSLIKDFAAEALAMNVEVRVGNPVA